MKEVYECNECGLIYWGELINLVEGERGGIIGNYCPNCGTEGAESREDLEPVLNT